MGRFRPQSRHILPFIPQFSWILNEFTLFDLSAVGLGTTRKRSVWSNYSNGALPVSHWLK